MLRRTIFAAVVFVCNASAQFFSLATTNNGAVLYFATPLRLKNTMQTTSGKLFRLDKSGLSIQEMRAEQVPEPIPPGPPLGVYHLSNAFDLQSVDVSSDERVIAAVARRYCIGDVTLCGKTEEYYVTTITRGSAHDYPGRLSLSAAGTWAFGPGGGVPFITQMDLRTW